LLIADTTFFPLPQPVSKRIFTNHLNRPVAGQGDPMRTSDASSASSPPIEWSKLLAKAVAAPGVIHDAY
jgi:hypothetical protein